MSLLSLESASSLDGLRHLVDRLAEPALHVLSPVERVGLDCFCRCSCGHLWSGDRAMDAPKVCPVADLDADTLADLARVLAADVQGRSRLAARSQLEQTHLHWALSA